MEITLPQVMYIICVGLAIVWGYLAITASAAREFSAAAISWFMTLICVGLAIGFRWLYFVAK